MGDLLLLGLALGLGVGVALAPLERALLVALPAWVLLPGPLVVPNPVTPAATFHRLVLVALAIAWWRARRDRASDELASPLAQCTGPLGAGVVGLALVLAYVAAIGPLGPASAGPGGWLLEVATWADRLATLVVVGLVAADLARRPDRHAPWALARGLVLALVLTAVVAGWELATGRAWGQMLFTSLGSLQGLDAAAPLEVRGGLVRVRAGAEFALELGWLVTVLLPAALAVTFDDPDRRWRLVGTVAAVMVPGVVLATQARTALVAVPVVVLVWVLLARLDPSPRWVVAASALVAVGLLALAVGAPAMVDVDVDAGSVEVRAQRLELLTDAVSERPVTGLGVGAVDRLGLQTTDSSYLQLYGELGVVGVGLLVVALVVALGAAVPGLADPSPTRPLVVAAVVGAVVLVAGSFAYDALTVQGSGRVVWALLGVGGALAGATAPALTLGRNRALGATAVVLASATVLVAMPRVPAVEVRFLTVPSSLEAGGGDPVVPFGRTYTATVCDVVGVVAQEAGLDGRCRDEGTAAGMGRFRLAGRSREAVATATARIQDGVAASGAVPDYRTFTVRPLRLSRPVWVTTAPITAGVVVLGLLLLPTTEPGVRWRPRRGRVPA